MACMADEGRGEAAKRPGERLPRGDAGVPGWSNPVAVMRGGCRLDILADRGDRGN